ncbi:MAG: GAF domain-containing protein, partial [Leptolyngbyaceae cyanobacterium bins.59]|nr:GAF domain-containing protein [Leptolyngbyaceae cyanobacterium bins.59]
MKPSIATLFSHLTPSALSALEDCNEQSLYAPGYVQNYGMLLLLEEATLRILQVSENVESWFGTPAESLLNQPLQRLFLPEQVQKITELLKQPSLEVHNPLELETQSSVPSGRSAAQSFTGVFHRTGAGLLLELEPQSPGMVFSPLLVYQRLQATIANLRRATSLSHLAQVLAREVKALTGFDRVMIYRFEADEHGVVIVEEKESHLESFLGLHFPATDIPVPSRQLFYRNWVRQIPDVNAPPARLIAAVDTPPLDLSSCVLRGVSPYHIEYLQNMGVAGTLTLSLIDDQRLWGLIACHHSTPRFLDYSTRKTCEFLGQFASIELVNQQERELKGYRTQVKVIQDRLQQAFIKDFNFIEQVLTRNGNQLLKLVHAQGAAIVLGGQFRLVGQTPSAAEVQDLVTWLMKHQTEHQSDGAAKPERVFATSTLSQVYPPAK